MRTAENIQQYVQELRESPGTGKRSLLNALNGGFIAPSPGGDAVRNPNTLPTGRNLFGINAEATPGVRAWDEGKALAKSTLDRYYRKHGDIRVKSVTLFGRGSLSKLRERLWLRLCICWGLPLFVTE